MKADDIIKVAREELRNFIIFEVKALSQMLNREQFEIYNYDLETTPTIGVWVWEDDDSGYTEYHRFNHIVFDEKNNNILIYLETFNGDGIMKQVFNEMCLSTDELYAIASAIEVTYRHKKNNII